jgi:C_GCAxxG_C_C family probable redox protein
MSKADDAAARFKEGFSCSQAVVSSFSGELGLDSDTANKISCGFGAGIARTGNTCGAVAGAVMVIGLKYGKAEAGDDAAKERTYALVQEFIEAFRAKNGSINCTELLGYDLRDPGQRTSAHASQAVAAKCPGFTRDAEHFLIPNLRRHSENEKI